MSEEPPRAVTPVAVEAPLKPKIEGAGVGAEVVKGSVPNPEISRSKPKTEGPSMLSVMTTPMVTV
jgi:hypothetical protein